MCVCVCMCGIVPFACVIRANETLLECRLYNVQWTTVPVGTAYYWKLEVIFKFYVDYF